MGAFRQDLRYALRVLRARPLVTVLAVLCLGIGIGASTAIFAPIDVFMLRPLAYPHSDRLISTYVTNAERGWTQVPLSMPDFLDYRAKSKTVDLAGFYNQSFNLSGGSETPERLTGIAISSNFFRVLGTPLAAGHTFTSDDEPVGHAVAVISNELWVRRFGADPAVLGKTIRLDGQPYTVVGVTQPGFEFPGRGIDVFTPLALTGTEARSSHYVRTVGRLRTGASFDAAGGEMTAIARGLAATYPDADAGNGVSVISLHDWLFDEHFTVASTVAGLAVALLLLIAVTNVTNLLLAQVAGREREIAIRTAIGAGRRRIVRQLLTESTVLGLLGGGLGVALAYPMLAGLLAIMPSNFPRVSEIAIDGRVIACAVVITLLVGALAGLAPALRVGRRDLRSSLQDGGRGSVLARGGSRLRNALVVSQVSLALVLLVASGLLVKGFRSLRRVDLGFQTEHVLTAQTDLSPVTYADDDAARRFARDAVERLEAIPGVVSAGMINDLPFTSNNITYYEVEGTPAPEGRRPTVSFRVVTPTYFQTVGMNVRLGRGFTAEDRAGAPRAIIVNQRFAERHWPNGSALGKRLIFPSGTWEIVGVVHDAFENGPDIRAPAMVYFPFDQLPYRQIGIAVQANGDPDALGPAMRAAIAQVDPDQPLFGMLDLSTRVTNGTKADGVLSEIMATLAFVAFVLAVIGVYGVMAYSVGQRTQEIGIRMAMGAQTSDVSRMMVRHAAKIIGIGTAAGLVLAAAVSKSLSLFLFGVSAFDPLTFGGVTVTLVLTAILASYLPARRAAKVDPLTALRAE